MSINNQPSGLQGFHFWLFVSSCSIGNGLRVIYHSINYLFLLGNTMIGFADTFLFVVFIIFVGLLSFLLITAWRDRHQKEHAVLVNLPVIGHLRYYFEDLGKYFRQYWFATDDEERPFSRAVRSQVYRMAKGISNNLSFGASSHDKPEIFRNALFPLEKDDADNDRSWIIGADCDQPFVHNKIVNMSGMSFGALSANAITALSKGAAESGITMNTGEGGRPSEFHRTPEMMDTNKPGRLVVQLGTANFGYRDEDGYLDYDQLADLQNDESVAYLQIKLSQGAKPGKGGILPGEKVSPEIARLRGVTPGVNCISPNINPDCRTPEALCRTIRKIKIATGKPVGIKVALATTDELRETLALAVKMDKELEVDGPSHLPSSITVDGGDGGTGSAPALFMESLALPVRHILPDVHQMMIDLGVRDQIHLVASGRLVATHEVAVALAMGADSVETARGMMMAIGCINALECYKGTCVAGLATQDPKLQKALDPEVKSKRVINYSRSMEKELFDLALACGLRHPQDFDLSHLVPIRGSQDQAAVFFRQPV